MDEMPNGGGHVRDLRMKLTRTPSKRRFTPYKSTEVTIGDETNVSPITQEGTMTSPLIAEATEEGFVQNAGNPCTITVRQDLLPADTYCVLPKENDVPEVSHRYLVAIQVLQEKEVVYRELDRVTEQWEQLRVAREVLIRRLNLLDNKLLRVLK